MGHSLTQPLEIRKYMIKRLSVTSGMAVKPGNPLQSPTQQKEVMFYDTLKASTSYQSTDYMHALLLKIKLFNQ